MNSIQSGYREIVARAEGVLKTTSVKDKEQAIHLMLGILQQGVTVSSCIVQFKSHSKQLTHHNHLLMHSLTRIICPELDKDRRYYSQLAFSLRQLRRYSTMVGN